MKYLYFVLTFLLHFFLFWLLGRHEQFVIMFTLSMSVMLVGFLFYQDTNKDKSIKQLGWGMAFGSLSYLVVFGLTGLYIYYVTITSPF
jgi:hypothetical protein